MASKSEIVQNVATLLLESSNNGEDTFNEPTTSVALSAKTVLAPDNSGSDLTFSKIVSGFNMGDINESPESRYTLEDVATSASRFGMVTRSALV